MTTAKERQMHPIDSDVPRVDDGVGCDVPISNEQQRQRRLDLQKWHAHFCDSTYARQTRRCGWPRRTWVQRAHETDETEHAHPDGEEVSAPAQKEVIGASIHRVRGAGATQAKHVNPRFEFNR